MENLTNVLGLQKVLCGTQDKLIKTLKRLQYQTDFNNELMSDNETLQEEIQRLQEENENLKSAIKTVCDLGDFTNVKVNGKTIYSTLK